MKGILIYLFSIYTILLCGQSPPFSIQYGHNDQISDVVFTSDGTQLYSAGKDGIINVWDIRNGANIYTYRGLSGPVNAISISDGDSLLVVGLNLIDRVKLDGIYSKKVALIHLHRKEITYPFELPEEIDSLPFWNFSFFNDNEYLAGWTYNQVFVWNLKKGRLLTTIKLDENERPIGLINASNKFLSKNMEDGLFSTHTLLSKKTIKKNLKLKPSKRFPFPLIHPNGKWVIYMDVNGRTILSDIISGEEVRALSFNFDKKKYINHSHYFSPEGKFIATVYYSRPPFKFDLESTYKYNLFTDVIISEVSTGKEVYRFEQTEKTFLNVKFSPIANSLVLYGGNNYLPVLHLWDWKNNSLLKELIGKVGKVDIIQKDNNESLIAFADIDYRTLRILDMKTLTIKPLEDIRLFGEDIYDKNVKNVGATALAFDNPGKKLISSNWRNKIYVWNLDNYSLDNIIVSPDSNEIINNICFGHDNNHFLTGSEFGMGIPKSMNDFMGQVKLQDSISFYDQWLKKDNENLYDIHLKKEDKLNKLKYWNLQDENYAGFKDLHKSIYSIKYIPSKERFTTIEYKNGVATAAWWQLETGEQVDFIPMDYLDSNFRNFAISEKGTLFARGTENGKVEIYEENGYKLELIEQHPISSLVFSKSGKYIAVGLHASHQINIWDIEKKEKIKSLKGHWNTIQHLIFLEDDDMLVSCSIDGNMIFWDLGKEELLFYCVSLRDNNESVIISKENYYKSTKNGVQALVVNDGGRTYSFEQFDLRLNRPDKVLSLLPNTLPEVVEAYRKAYLKRLEKLSFTEEMLNDDFHTPEIIVDIENIPNLTKNDQLNFIAEAVDTRDKLDRINVWVNDVPIYGTNGLDLRSKDTNKWKENITLQLSRGKNKIQVSTTNQGAAESLKETFYVTYKSPIEKPNLYFVSIGVAQHIDTSKILEYPAKDALDLSSLFNEDNKYFENIYIETLIDKNVVLDSFEMIKNLLDKSSVDDVVVIFYAGHGMIDSDYNLYLSSYNVNFNDPKEFGLPYEKLESLLDGIPARQKLLLMDACHSGEIDSGNLKKGIQEQKPEKEIRFRSDDTDSTLIYSQLGLDNSFELMKDLFVDLRRSTGATVISSAGGVEMAWESSELQNGVFTYALIEGLKEKTADEDRDGKVLVSELQKYLRQRVPEMTDGLQQPTSRVFNITNDFRIW